VGIAAPGLPYTHAGGLYGFDPATGLPYSSKTKVTAGLLGIFLGGFGVGRFYTGHIGLAFGQLLLTIFGFGLGALWGFIDGIVMLAGSPRDSAGRPLR
jgi:TM2 domain-containing membrane protein YozV